MTAWYLQLELFEEPEKKTKKKQYEMKFKNPRMNKGLFTSGKDEWETPQEFFDQLNEEFGFELDVCALPENAKCERYFTPEEDGLKQEWTGVCWMNPPYGREIGKWVRKAYESSQKGATVVCLLPARTDTQWFHKYCMKAAEVRFVRGRIRFGGSKENAPFPSCVVVFKRTNEPTKFSSMEQPKIKPC